MLLVRRAVEADWEQSRAIRLRALRDEPLAFASTYEREIHFTPDQWREWIATSAQFLAQTDNGDIVGTATGFTDPTETATVHLVAMFVAPGARRAGVGGQLVAAVIEQAQAEGARWVRLHVVEANADAERLYARCGFVRTGATMPLPHRPELIEHEMALELPG